MERHVDVIIFQTRCLRYLQFFIDDFAFFIRFYSSKGKRVFILTFGEKILLNQFIKAAELMILPTTEE